MTDKMVTSERPYAPPGVARQDDDGDMVTSSNKERYETRSY